MGTVSVNKPVTSMLSELSSDLARDDLVLVERMPQIKETERYRDVVISMLREFHIALVLVRLVFRSGEVKGYVFLIKGDVGGEAPSSGHVEGYVIVRDHRGRVTKYIYNPEDAPLDYLAREVLTFADLYRKAEERIIKLGLTEAYRDKGFFTDYE
ncbi:MAG: hypothetical protein RXQ00_09645 [Caldivirga sp.]